MNNPVTANAKHIPKAIRGLFLGFFLIKLIIRNTKAAIKPTEPNENKVNPCTISLSSQGNYIILFSSLGLSFPVCLVLRFFNCTHS